MGARPLRFCFRQPPSLWKAYPETKQLSPMQLQTLWQGWLAAIYHKQHPASLKLIHALPLITLQRLARLGAITRPQAAELKLLKQLQQPIHDTMEVPKRSPPRTDRDFIDELLLKEFPQLPAAPRHAAGQRLKRIL